MKQMRIDVLAESFVFIHLLLADEQISQFIKQEEDRLNKVDFSNRCVYWLSTPHLPPWESLPILWLEAWCKYSLTHENMHEISVQSHIVWTSPTVMCQAK